MAAMESGNLEFFSLGRQTSLRWCQGCLQKARILHSVSILSLGEDESKCRFGGLRVYKEVYGTYLARTFYNTSIYQTYSYIRQHTLSRTTRFTIPTTPSLKQNCSHVIITLASTGDWHWPTTVQGAESDFGAQPSVEYHITPFSQGPGIIVEEVVNVYKKTWTYSSWDRLHKTCTSPSQTKMPARRRGVQEVPPLAEELLVIDSCQEKES